MRTALTEHDELGARLLRGDDELAVVEAAVVEIQVQDPQVEVIVESQDLVLV